MYPSVKNGRPASPALQLYTKMKVMKSILLSTFLLSVSVSATAVAQEAGFTCVAPVFPSYSASPECARRVEKQVREWRACNVERASAIDARKLVEINDAVNARLEKWLVATRSYSNGQADGQSVLSRIERDRIDYAMWLRDGHSGTYRASRQ